MNTSIIICAGKNANSRSETANSLRSGQAAIVIEAADYTSLQKQLKPYGSPMQLRVMLQYFHTPDKTILLNPQRWWNAVGDTIENSSPRIFGRATVKANLNRDTGGGFLMFTWETISSIDLESFFQVLFDKL